jgi:hypothetical protein
MGATVSAGEHGLALLELETVEAVALKPGGWPSVAQDGRMVSIRCFRCSGMVPFPTLNFAAVRKRPGNSRAIALALDFWGYIPGVALSCLLRYFRAALSRARALPHVPYLPVGPMAGRAIQALHRVAPPVTSRWSGW